MRKYLPLIAWETEVWCADDPTHLIQPTANACSGPTCRAGLVIGTLHRPRLRPAPRPRPARQGRGVGPLAADAHNPVTTWEGGNPFPLDSPRPRLPIKQEFVPRFEE